MPKHHIVVLVGLIIMLVGNAYPGWAASIDTLEFESPSMRKKIRNLVILPKGYTDASERPYPVLFLLHGWSGNYSSWLSDAPQLLQRADQYNLIIVCPDGGYDSWYFDSPIDSTIRYETMVSVELIGQLDQQYTIRNDPAGRAISGLSMGGHGALYLAIRHPEVFGAAGSICGGLDLRPFRRNDWDLNRILGKDDAIWDKFGVAPILDTLKGRSTTLIIDCGIDDFFIEVNRAAHRKLLELDYPHEYTERPGEHNKDYWSNAVDFQLLFFSKFFNR